MDIRKCTPDDIESINDLMSLVKFRRVDVCMFEDLTLGAFSEGICYAFVWVGIPESRYMANIDFAAVMPGTKGIGSRMAQETFAILRSMGVKRMMSVVEYSGTENEEKSLQLNAKCGMSPMSKPYHFCIGDIEENR